LNCIKKIENYNKHENIRTLERTEELMSELQNIHIYRERRSSHSEEKNDFESMFFDWYPDEEWNYGDIYVGKNKKQGWYIKTNKEQDIEDRPGTSGYTPTTSSTTTTTEDVLLDLLDNLQVNDRFKYLRDEFRKKRQHIHNDDFECPEVTTIKPNGFWCSSFYLRINPIQYFLCKWTGHRNLHFFW
jgi:hypothetical protein